MEAPKEAKFRRTPVRPVRVDLICPICGGAMGPTGMSTLTNPPQIEHKCGNGHYARSPATFPRIEYDEISEGL